MQLSICFEEKLLRAVLQSITCYCSLPAFLLRLLPNAYSCSTSGDAKWCSREVGGEVLLQLERQQRNLG